MAEIRHIINDICGGPLSFEQTEEVFTRLVQGELDEIEIAALLIALKTRGEHPHKIAGAAQALRRAALPFPRPDYGYADSCGTGGDGAHTVNISTAVALVAAEAGLPIAKHGNRSVSSSCGSADVLQALGVQIEISSDAARRCLDEVGICFLFAPQYHAGLRHAMRVRTLLKVRTILNLLGPLVNPATPPWQMMGVYDPALCRPLAETLGLLGCQSAMVVHGSGLDELALHAESRVAWWHDDRVFEMVLQPEDADLCRHPLSALAGGTPDQNADSLLSLLSGRGSEALQASVAMNTGALLWISGRVPNLKEGTHQAMDVLRTDGGLQRLERWKKAAHGA